MAVETTRWDSAEYLKTHEDIAAYLDAVLEEDDPALVAHALGVIARAKGIAQLVQDTGLERETLLQSLSTEGALQFATVQKLVKALGLRLHTHPQP